MTHRHSILRLHPLESGLKLMLLVSLLIHVLILALFIGKPPDTSKKIFYSPVYSVTLLGGQAAPGASQDTGKSSGRKVSLWKGPSPLDSKIKAQEKRVHDILTIPKKTAVKTKKKPAGENNDRKASQQVTGQGAGTKWGSAAQQGSTGRAGSGPATPQNLRFSRYYQAIWNKIKNAWILPHYGNQAKNLEAIVVIRINRDGKILKSYFEKKSGDTRMDNSVLRAIKKADPLPPLPTGFREQYLEIGIRFVPE